MKIKTIINFLSVYLGACLFASAAHVVNALEYSVAKHGKDTQSGDITHPFLTIGRAAEVAVAGDTITVHSGIYREWVNPKRGGQSEAKRIVYQATANEDVRIVGSESAKGWEKDGNLWRLTLDDAYFGDYNPFNLTIRHPVFVTEDEEGDGFGWLKYGREILRGDVFLNGHWLSQYLNKNELNVENSWYAEHKGNVTRIWANFGTQDPNQADVEISKRPYAFYPTTPGLSYITLKGFVVMNIANHWAPPTVHQPGAIGPNGGNHWIIEHNIILNAKAVCISLGVPTGEADSSKAGYHIVRNNIIMHCDQNAISGQGWNSNSIITDNHIEAINERREFGGYETAAIKFHNAFGSRIEHNFIRGVYTGENESSAAHGIWIDFKNENIRITRNIILNVSMFAVLIEANDKGPVLIDNNVIVGGGLANMSSRGDAWVNNLFFDTYGVWQNQQYGGRSRVQDSRWYNNVFIKGSLENMPANYIHRLGAENYKIPSEPSFRFGANVYLDEAHQVAAETTSYQLKSNTQFKLRDDGKKIILSFILPNSITKVRTKIITAKFLNLALTDLNGKDIVINRDFFGRIRTSSAQAFGPFIAVKPSMNTINLYRYPKGYQRAKLLLGE